MLLPSVTRLRLSAHDRSCFSTHEVALTFSAARQAVTGHLLLMPSLASQCAALAVDCRRASLVVWVAAAYRAYRALADLGQSSCHPRRARGPAGERMKNRWDCDKLGCRGPVGEFTNSM